MIVRLLFSSLKSVRFATVWYPVLITNDFKYLNKWWIGVLATSHEKGTLLRPEAVRIKGCHGHPENRRPNGKTC